MKSLANERYVFIDTETGGTISTKHSLLSIGLVIWDKAEGIIGNKEFYVKSKRYIITKEAGKVNKFNKVEHNRIAQEPKILIEQMLDYVRNYFPEDILIPIAGHNIQFDANFLKEFFKKNGRSFYQYFSHRMIDTYSVYKTLVLAGLIDKNINSSSDAFKYFDINVEKRHNALNDCLATVELYEKMLIIIQNRNRVNI